MHPANTQPPLCCESSIDFDFRETVVNKSYMAFSGERKTDIKS
jgi:hypothetical protein